MELSREEKIRDDVNTHLVWDNRIDAKDIRVEVVGSRVILIGTVPSYSDRWQAEDDAYSIPGVRSVDNRLKVVPAVSPAPSDTDIRLRVENVLNWNPSIDSSGILVSVDHGVVTLYGTVPSCRQKDRAWDLASGVSGVVDVVNDLKVRLPEETADQTIKGDILNTLDRHTLIDTGRVDVTVQGGIVTLRGIVDNYKAFRTVEEIAKSTHGVIEVRNELVIA